MVPSFSISSGVLLVIFRKRLCAVRFGLFGCFSGTLRWTDQSGEVRWGVEPRCHYSCKLQSSILNENAQVAVKWKLSERRLSVVKCKKRLAVFIHSEWEVVWFTLLGALILMSCMQYSLLCSLFYTIHLDCTWLEAQALLKQFRFSGEFRDGIPPSPEIWTLVLPVERVVVSASCLPAAWVWHLRGERMWRWEEKAQELRLPPVFQEQVRLATSGDLLRGDQPQYSSSTAAGKAVLESLLYWI